MLLDLIGVHVPEVDLQTQVAEVVFQMTLDRAFIAGDDGVMAQVIRTDAEVRRCLLGSQDRPDTYARLASEMGCTSVQPLNRITTSAFCEEAHQLGLVVHPFYADDEKEMLRLIECGVDGILTNEPQRLTQLLARLG